MKNINEYLNEGFFSNVGGSLSDVKKLLAPIFEMNNPNRKNHISKKVIYDILTKLPEKFGFNIYKYNRREKIIQSFKYTKEEDDMFWARYSNNSGNSASHCAIEIVVDDVYSLYFATLPLKVVMTFDGDEVK